MLVEKGIKEFWWQITSINFEGHMRYHLVNCSESEILEVCDQFYDFDTRNVTYEKLRLVEE